MRDASDRSLSCSAVISTSTTVVSLVSQNPVSYTIFTLIQTVISVTFTCTASEKAAIQSVTASVTQAIVVVQAEVTHVKEVFVSKFKFQSFLHLFSCFLGVTGREVTDSEIESATVCKTDDECDSLVDFPTESATTAAATSTAAPAPTPAAPAPAAPTTVAAPTPAAPTTEAAPTSEAPSSAAPSPAETTQAGASPPAETSPPAMTTGASTRRARRYVQQLMRKRMVQTLL